MQQWEYALLTESPAGPQVLTLTVYRLHGAETTIYKSGSYDEGQQHTLPHVIAQLGIDGWEMFAIAIGAWHFKRPIAPS
ncbi:MAG: hypothetical protein AAF787_09290 [Chloroflexota bacterium]